MKMGDKYSIGEVEKICDVPIKTLRYYDGIKLVIPKFRDEESKYRYYSKDQLVTICIIRKLRMLGFGLKEIHHIVNDNNAHNLEKSIDRKLLEIGEEINTLQEKLANGYAFSQRLKEGVDMLSFYNQDDIVDKGINIEEIPETDLVFTRKIMQNYSYSEVSLERWVGIINLCNSLKLKSKGSIVVTYYSNPLDQFLSMDSDIEFGMYIESTYKSKNCRKFGGFTAATTIHVGDYSKIIHTHIEMIQWINKNGYKIAGNISEEFIISPFDVNNPEEHVTKVIIPVTKSN